MKHKLVKSVWIFTILLNIPVQTKTQTTVTDQNIIKGLTFDYTYPGDTKFVYANQNGTWYGKNSTTNKIYNISKNYPANAKNLASGAVKSQTLATTTSATTLGEFAAGTVDGFTASTINVVTWFDQSGNGKNITNAITTQQPMLVNTGVLQTSGGIVAVRFTRASSTNLKMCK